MHPRKSPFVFAMPCLLALALPAPVSAHEGRKPVPPTSVATDGETRDVIEVVDRFSAALKSGDMTTVSALLHPAVVVLESGGAERSRDEYFAHHAAADADFLRGAEVRPGPRSAHRRGELAWVAYPAGWYERTSCQQNIDLPESVIDRRDHLASTLWRDDIVAGG